MCAVTPRAGGPRRTRGPWQVLRLTWNAPSPAQEGAGAWDPRGLSVLELGEPVPRSPSPSVLSLNAGERPFLIRVHTVGLVPLMLGFFSLGVLG